MITYKLEKNKKILILGGRGMVGSAIIRFLKRFNNINIINPTHKDLNLLDNESVNKFMQYHKPDAVIMAAAKVGGIIANSSHNAAFMYENLMMNTNVIQSSYNNGIETLCFLGSSCIYPRICEQPIHENLLLSGPLENTNEGYALAKIAGLKLCEHYRNDYGVKYFSVMPTNLYGPNDNYNEHYSHVIPSIINKFETARILNDDYSIEFLGDGTALREFLYVDDLATAIIKLLEISENNFDTIPNWINIGSGSEISILDLINLIKTTCKVENIICFSYNETLNNIMNGTHRKLLDSSIIRSFGWNPSVSLVDGLKFTINDYRQSLINNSLRR